MSMQTYSQLVMINPYRLWQVTTYDNIGGFDNHAWTCYYCYAFLHYANKYNIFVSSLATDSVANTGVLDAPLIADLSNSGVDAIDVTNSIWNNLCVTGVGTVERYVNLWTSDNYDTR